MTISLLFLTRNTRWPAPIASKEDKSPLSARYGVKVAGLITAPRILFCGPRLTLDADVRLIEPNYDVYARCERKLGNLATPF